MSSPSEEKDLEEYLSGGTEISRRYRALNREEPPAALDRAVLARAGGRRRSRWAAPLALAATILVSFAILRERIPTVGRPVPAPGVLLAGVVVVLLGLFPGVAWTLAATR